VLRLFADNLLPVFLAAGAGYLVAWRLRVDPRPASQLAFFVFAPCLVFQVVVDSHVPEDDVLHMVAFATVGLLALGAATALVGWRLGWPRSLVAAAVLVVLLPNAGNFGLSANRFAFGEAGLAQASVYFLVSSLLTFTVGIFVASLGRSGLRATLLGMLRVPAMWALFVALLLARTGGSLPTPLARTVELFSHASIPVFLIVLGMQLYGRGVTGPYRPLVLAATMRLVGGAAVGLLLAGVLGLHGATRQAGVLQSGMPSAVITIVLATEYDVEPAFVTSVVITTTVLCPLTLTPLLSWLVP